MVDAFIYILAWSHKLHKIKSQSTAIEDKLIYAILSTTLVKSIIYLGYMMGVDTPAFIILSHLGDVGIFVVALLIGLMAHTAFKEKKLKTATL